MNKYFDHVPPDWVESLSEDLPVRINELPPWLKKKLFDLGTDGEGFNNHLLGCAKSLSPHFKSEELREILTASQNAYGRDDPREIDKVIVKAYEDSPSENSFPWPKPDPLLQAKIFINSEVKTMQDLTETYGIESEETLRILKGSFPDDPYVCLGKSVWESVTMRLSEHLKCDLSKMQFIVPSAMIKPTGLKKDGKASSRCLDNTGPRQILVIEFDEVALEFQAAAIHHLAGIAPLILVISSGGESLHAWFDCRELSEDLLRRFTAYAVRLGADPAMFTRCQLARTPGAIRDNGNEQSVIVHRPFDARLEEWHIEELLETQAVEAASGVICASDLVEKYPSYRQVIIEGLLRQGETMNIIAAPKTGKSWLGLEMSLVFTNGAEWLGRKCASCPVLLVDNELHLETLSQRIAKVKEATGLEADGLHVLPKRGQDCSLETVANEIISAAKECGAGVIILDALYRMLSPRMVEGSNSDMTGLYNMIDRIARETGCAVIPIHHSSKGNQSEKQVTDGGSGAGAISRAADTHMFLRPHKTEGFVSVHAVVRTFKPPEPFVISRASGRWQIEDGADPEALKGNKSSNASDKITDEALLKFLTDSHSDISTITAKLAAGEFKISREKLKGHLSMLTEAGTIYRSTGERGSICFGLKPGTDETKRAKVLSAHRDNPNASRVVLAKIAECTERYVSKVLDSHEDPL